jgi:hypothetical protein
MSPRPLTTNDLLQHGFELDGETDRPALIWRSDSTG